MHTAATKKAVKQKTGNQARPQELFKRLEKSCDAARVVAQEGKVTAALAADLNAIVACLPKLVSAGATHGFRLDYVSQSTGARQITLQM